MSRSFLRAFSGALVILVGTALVAEAQPPWVQGRGGSGPPWMRDTGASSWTQGRGDTGAPPWVRETGAPP